LKHCRSKHYPERELVCQFQSKIGSLNGKLLAHTA
jgi:hypothetical protein